MKRPTRPIMKNPALDKCAVSFPIISWRDGLLPAFFTGPLPVRVNHSQSNVALSVALCVI